MIQVEHLTKKYGSKIAVDDLSFSLTPGRVTGFLGPNGSGKSTTMRCIVGLDRPTSGRTTIGGVAYTNLASPLTSVGALLDGKAFHPARTARGQLRIVAASHGIAKKRVDEVLELTGLREVASKRLRGFSLGMGQRLGIAIALLGDPEVLILDEPVNGLDPDGVRWVRTLMRDYAARGRTVFVSSHLMSEMEVTADDLIIIGRGKLLASGPIRNFTENAAHATVHVVGPDVAGIEAALRAENITFTFKPPSDEAPSGRFLIEGATSPRIGHLAFTHGLELHELSELHSSLEDIFIELTQSSVEYDVRTGAATVGYGQPDPTFLNQAETQMEGDRS